MTRKLIINADDFGWDFDTYATTVEAMEQGSITSATIMTGCPATEAAGKFASSNSENYSFGLHFNIVDCHTPIIEDLLSLIDPLTNKFKESNRQRIGAILFRLKIEEIMQELEAQLKILGKMGVKVTHIDSHGHLHKFPNIFFAVKKIMASRNINFIRRPQNLYVTETSVLTKLINLSVTPFFGTMNKVDYFIAMNVSEVGWFDRLLKNLPNGITELAVHPGRFDGWRALESNPLLEIGFINKLLENQVKLVNYNLM